MLLTDNIKIQEVLLFPAMKPIVEEAEKVVAATTEQHHATRKDSHKQEEHVKKEAALEEVAKEAAHHTPAVVETVEKTEEHAEKTSAVGPAPVVNAPAELTGNIVIPPCPQVPHPKKPQLLD